MLESFTMDLPRKCPPNPGHSIQTNQPPVNPGRFSPALTGTLGVRESSYTTRAGLTGLSMTSRPWNSRPDGPKTSQKFANELAREKGAPQD